MTREEKCHLSELARDHMLRGLSANVVHFEGTTGQFSDEYIRNQIDKINREHWERCQRYFEEER